MPDAGADSSADEYRATSVDAAETLIEGPWRHRFVAANGARFHIAEAGVGPLVMLLHGFPEFWWAWRHQLPALAAAGYRAVALDLRGYGASDKPPRGYDTITLAADVAGVIRALGETSAVIVGHDWGGWLAWSMPGLAPRETRAIAALSMPHPLTLRTAVAGLRDSAQRRAWRPVLDFQVPMRPEHRLVHEDRALELIEQWSAPRPPGSRPDRFPDPEAQEVYRRAMRVPFVAHSAMEYYRWALRSVPRRDGRRFAAAIENRITVPVLQLHGELDPFMLPATAVASHHRAGSALSYQLIPGAGHFLPEEAPDQVTSALLSWLAALP